MMKLCFVDFHPRTDVDHLFGYYRSMIEALKRERPGVRIAHATVPLTVYPDDIKSQLRRMLGKEVWEEAANVKRADYNRRLKEAFKSDPVFDLARAEASAPDASLTTFEQGGQRYQSLYPGYTEDGGHLNALGQRVVASAMLHFLAGALGGPAARGAA
jgi:lysophospholipase L1-like esterase